MDQHSGVPRPTETPVVSVVIPTYNRWTLLAEAIDSVVRQSFEGWELLVVDDGSTDETEERVRGLRDARIRFIPMPHTGVVARVRNEGIARARGRWIAFLDSDDLWKPQKLERQIAALARTGAVWSFTELEGIGPTGRVTPSPTANAMPRDPSDVLVDLIEDRSSASIITIVVDRDALAAIGGFSESADLAQRIDRDLVFRLAARFPSAPVPEILVSVREHAGRGTRSLDDPFLASANLFRALLKRDPPPPVRRAARRVLARHLTASAGIDLRAGDRRRARAKLRECAWPGVLQVRWWWRTMRAVVTG